MDEKTKELLLTQINQTFLPFVIRDPKDPSGRNYIAAQVDELIQIGKPLEAQFILTEMRNRLKNALDWVNGNAHE